MKKIITTVILSAFVSVSAFADGKSVYKMQQSYDFYTEAGYDQGDEYGCNALIRTLLVNEGSFEKNPAYNIMTIAYPRVEDRENNACTNGQRVLVARSDLQDPNFLEPVK